MRKTAEILRLKHEAGLSNRQISQSCGLSHPTVAKYLERAEEAGLSWPLPKDLDEDQLEQRLFPEAHDPGPQPSRPLAGHGAGPQGV